MFQRCFPGLTRFEIEMEDCSAICEREIHENAKSTIYLMIFQEWRAEEAVLEEGLSHDVGVDVTSSGEPVVRTEEHYLARRMDRLNDKIRHNLRDLGLLEDEDHEPSVVGSTFESEHVSITISEPSSSELEDDVDD